jgi:MFS superfamily sulfate permease-like transporter
LRRWPACFDTLPGLFIGIAISMLLLVYRVSRPRVAVLGRVPGTAGQYGDVERHPENEVPDGIVVLRVESGLFFANAEHVRALVRRHVARDTGAIVLDAETMPSIDVSGARMLAELAGVSSATASCSSSRATSARSATSCAGPGPAPRPSGRIPPSGPPSTRSRPVTRRSPRRKGASGTVPAWLRSYRREWARADLIAGLVIWSVVTPQAVAYAQIAGLPPAAGLIAAPGALLGYALVGGSRTLVISATTATSALSASAVGPLAGGDAARFAALSAAFALVTAAVLVLSGALRLGAVADLVSKPVMTGFLFGLGLTIAVGQLPEILGVPDGDGTFFPRVADLAGDLGSVHAWTAAVGLASIAALVLLRRLAPHVPGILVVLAAGIVVSAALGLEARDVDVVGHLPAALRTRRCRTWGSTTS